MGVIPNPKMVFIFPISCILALIFPIVIKYFPKCEGKGSFLKSQIKSLIFLMMLSFYSNGQIIGISEPRRVAAISMSQRVSTEMSLSPR